MFTLEACLIIHPRVNTTHHSVIFQKIIKVHYKNTNQFYHKWFKHFILSKMKERFIRICRTHESIYLAS